MSIATLKKKTNQKYNAMSVNHPSFSLNGGTRNTSYIGQSNTSRHFPMTPHRGATARGNGGCCGQYRQTNVISGINYQNDSSIIKPSVVGTYGMLATKYRWIRRPAPETSVKPDVNMNLNTQSSYITHLEKSTLAYINKNDKIKTKSISKYPCPFPRAQYLNYNMIANSSCNTTKEIGSLTQGMYLVSLDKACGTLDAKNLPVNIGRTPFVSTNYTSSSGPKGTVPIQ
jgi:hypothetical protein